jgi:hypothetical protein
MGLRTPPPAPADLTFPARQQARTSLAQGAASMQQSASLSSQQGGIGALGARGIAQAGAAMGAAQQAATTQAVQQGTQEQAQAAQDQLALEQAGKQDSLRALRLAISRQSRDLSQRLYEQEGQAGAEVFDNNLKFQQDELGRSSLNDRQLADYAVLTARNQEELANYEQQVAVAYERKQGIMKQAFAVLEQYEKQLFEAEQTEANQELQRRIALAKKKQADDLARLQNEGANRAAIWGAVSTVGAAITPIFPVAGLAIAGVGAAGSAYNAQQTQSKAAGLKASGSNI